ncbi:beta-ketoacyl-ACP synthase III [Rhodococcus sp. TAF43]|uniref:beta-ketoacyl-ACP synthase III n=1 Tax=unclassified Rhodococcus (in: high G+C Gram-positive bacteria) TaxID=192944 RepID=UPI000E0ADDD4|nr:MULTISPECIES: beta-ketoacyl-ACP synthase III [unclassified Rhodococcus (in: high G+C Gram-positive bacteria)]QKT11928.1 ketoacyl-ACP synthase III [Rhodococcus sp. W8901]RDI13065.1 3-oxoacyl-[acyl-carrier-protein] synthase III [Rhodococcus sp. AG1013]
MPAPIATAQPVAHAALLGLGVYRPRRVVPNSEIVDRIDSSDEWIRTRSGITARGWAEPDETIVSMSVAAARDALAAAGLVAEQIDAVVLATSSQMVLGPSAGAVVATELGMHDTAAYDISAGCAGFCYALGNAAGLVRAGQARHVLVIGVERLSDLLDPTDRTCAFIFADGAGAVVVGPSDAEGIGPVAWGSDGSQTAAIKQDKDFKQYFAEVEAAEADGGRTERPYIRMNGQAVFRWAVTFLEKACRDALEKSGVAADDLDAFVPHQANSRITDALIRTLGLPDTVAVARDIAETGNTSAASIPMAMEQLLRSGQARRGDTALLLGFGAGLAYAGQVVQLPPIVTGDGLG